MLRNRFEFGIVRDRNNKPIYDGFRYKKFFGCGCTFLTLGYVFITYLGNDCREYAKEKKEMESKNEDNASS